LQYQFQGPEQMFLVPNTHFPTGPNLIERIGLTIWWIAIFFIAISVASTAALLVWGGDGREFGFAICGLIALFAWAIGRIAIFILAGR
jgi:hypothetical protein